MALILKGPVKAVQELRCDKLAFTIRYETKAEQKMIAAGLQEIIKCKMGSSFSRRPYRCGVKVYEPDMNNKLRMLVQWAPFHESIPFVRIDVNPSHADMEAVHATLLTAIPSWHWDISNTASITRFDAAVDLIGVCPNELLAYYPSKQISAIHCKSGKVETYSLGKKGEDNFVQIYDKRLEIKEKNAKYGLKAKVPAEDVTRLEIRMKPECSFQDLLDAKNPFAKILLKTDYPLVKGDQLWRLFIATARFEGLQNALQRLDPATRMKFQKKVAEYPSLWWSPDTVWSAWPTVVIGLWDALGVSSPD